MPLPPALSRLDGHPFVGQDVPTLLAHRAATRADHPFIVWQPFEGEAQVWTYARFHHDVGRIAGGLRRRGVAAGDRVLIHLDNGPEALLAWYACGWIGAVAVTTNARAADDELVYYADHCGAVAAITQPRFAERVAASARALRWMVVTDTDNGEPPAHAVEPGQRFITLDAEPAPRRPPDPLAPCSVQYTSGTTSRPKAVLWTHANALWGARVNAVHEDLRADDVHLVHMPLFHTNAQAYSVLATLWAGGTAVVVPRFSASRFWAVSLAHRCTWASMIPFGIKALLAHEVPPRHHYRLWGAGACALPTDARFGVQTMGWWGMTETITHGIVSSPAWPSPSGAVGRPAPEYGIAIVDDDDERAVADARAVEPGGSGQLLVRGVRGLGLFQEYLGNAAATEASFTADGWFRTGDRVDLLADGSIRFGDRSKDMLKVGGENVAASEVERVVLAVPGVHECAVVAMPHPMLDEVPVAFVRPSPDAPPDLAARVIAACDAALADFKRPREVRLVDDFPRSTLEKIAKAVLREGLRAERRA